MQGKTIQYQISHENWKTYFPDLPIKTDTWPISC